MARAAVDEIVGRERELDAIAGLLDGGGALVLEGEAGIGKTLSLIHI